MTANFTGSGVGTPFLLAYLFLPIPAFACSCLLVIGIAGELSTQAVASGNNTLLGPVYGAPTSTPLVSERVFTDIYKLPVCADSGSLVKGQVQPETHQPYEVLGTSSIIQLST